MHRLALSVSAQRNPSDRISQLTACERVHTGLTVTIEFGNGLGIAGGLSRDGGQRVKRPPSLLFSGDDGVELTLERVAAADQLIDACARGLELPQ
jgi:hypothetical protein